MSAVSFHDTMTGFISATERDFRQAWLAGRRIWDPCSFDLRIEIDDVDDFLARAPVLGSARGTIDCPLFGGRLQVTDGTFNLFVDVAPGQARMKYRLFTSSTAGEPLTLSGFKPLSDSPGFDVWTDTTTLFTRILHGHVTEQQERDAPDEAEGLVAARGILRIGFGAFLRLVASMWPGDPRAIAKFGDAFAGDLFRIYLPAALQGELPDFPDPEDPGLERWDGHPPGEWHEPPELPGLHRRILGLTAGDGLALTLHQVRADPDVEPPRGPVLLLHGSGVRANLFHGAPGGPSVTAALVAAGWDVWLLNWRASIDLPPMPYTLDQAALYDHPAAIARVLEETGRDELAVLAHCQGSTSFVITAVSGLAPQVKHVVSSAVSLHPVVSPTSLVKLSTIPPLLGLLNPYVDAQWGILPPTPLAEVVSRLARTVRRECDDPVCALGNFMYGAGPDVLWRHAHLDSATHDWAAREFAWAPFRFMRQMGASVRAGHLVPYDHLDGLPDSYVGTPRIPDDATWTFIAGTRNNLFRHQSQIKTHAFFSEYRPGADRLVLIPGYGHLDVLFGVQSATQTMPHILQGLGGG